MITFHLINDKKVRLSQRLFCQILDIPNTPPFVEFQFSQIIHMFNEMGYQPPLTKISDFKKSGLPKVWNFLFGIFLHCLTGRTVGLDKGRMEVYAMVAGLYYDLPADYSTQLWKEFQKGLELTNAANGISCARYWSLILQYFYNKEGILVPNDEEKVTFQSYHFPKDVVDDANEFPNVARIPDTMLKRVNPKNSILVAYQKTFDPSIPT